jgi:hypothetical protein
MSLDIQRMAEEIDEQLRQLPFALTASQQRHIAKAGREQKIKERLGRKPEYAADFVRLYVNIEGLTVNFKEQITKAGESIDQLSLLRTLRLLADELGFSYRATAIADAVEDWIAQAKRDYFNRSKAALGTFDETRREHVESVWLNLASLVFDCSDTSPAFVAAVLKKYVWQVKCKLFNTSISYHLMPILFGPQGCGKTEFIRAFLSPIADLTTNASFSAIADERNIGLWSSYAIVCDEMAHASKTDIDDVKHAISAPSLSRRLMGTNTWITVAQKATLIGASNKDLSELIKDSTGLRRFAPLNFIGGHYTLVNSIDWLELWQSIDHMAADPMRGHEEVLAAVQEEERVQTPFEAWLADFDPASMKPHFDNGHISAAALFEDSFIPYEELNYRSFAVRMTRRAWDKKMNALCAKHPDKTPFQHVRKTKGIAYRYVGGSNG